MFVKYLNIIKFEVEVYNVDIFLVFIFRNKVCFFCFYNYWDFFFNFKKFYLFIYKFYIFQVEIFRCLYVDLVFLESVNLEV